MAKGKGIQPSVPVATRPMPYFKVILLGFVLLTVVGGILLMLPFSSASGKFTSPVTAFFTATSAVSATGLVTVDTADYWSFFGQVVAIILIQLGGVGFMVLTAFMLLLLRRRIDEAGSLVTEAAGAGTHRHFLVFTFSILLLTVFLEIVGAVLLFLKIQQTGADNPLWQSVFHAISAFNNAGFDLQGGFHSLVGMQQEIQFLGILVSLLIIGSLGVPIILEIFTSRPWLGWSLDIKISLVSVAALLAIGTVAIFLAEMSSPVGAELSFIDKVMNSFFQSASARTAGFTSVNVGALTIQTLLLLMLLMFVGGVSGSTAGGMKVNTFSTVFLTAVSYLRGNKRVHIFGRVIPEVQVHRAISVLFFGIAFVFIFTMLITITDQQPFINLLFEVVSAFTTTGFTTGITPELSTGGQIILIVAMFIGRLGPLTAVLALTYREESKTEEEVPEEAIRIG